MKITKVARQKRRPDRFSVFVDGEYSFSLSEESLVKSKLASGQEIDSDRMKAIAADEDRQRAMEDAGRLLGIRARSTRELRDRLRRKGYSDDTADAVLARLSELGYLDDSRFARDWAASLRERGKGPDLIRGELRKKGIDGETVAEVLGEMKETPEKEAAVVEELARRKLRQLRNLPPEVVARRLAGFLARRGFSIETVSAVLRSLRKERDRGD